MTRLLAFGDVHLGMGADFGAQPGDRLRDQEQALEQVARIAREHDTDAVLFVGDAFERRRPTPSELIVWQRFLARFGATPVVAIVGNHDVETADRPCAMELFATPWERRVFRVQTVAYVGDVAIAVLPWAPSSWLVAQRDGGDRDATHDALARSLVETARGLRAQIPDGVPAILALHWSVSGAVTPTGREVGVDFGVILPRAELESLGFDAIVCGHIHKRQELVPAPARLAGRPPFFYTGPPLPLSFGEAAGEHGVYILDVEPGKATTRFVAIESRRFVTVDVDLTEPEPQQGLDETDRLAAAIAERAPLEGTVVKIRYRATREQMRHVDVRALRRLCADFGVHKVYLIQPDPVRDERQAFGAPVDESIDELSALELWMVSQSINGAHADSLRALTTRYLQETRL